MHRLALLIVLNLLYLPGLFAAEEEISEAIHGLEHINGFEADAEVSAIPSAFASLPPHPSPAEVNTLFDEQALATWPGILADYLSLSAIMYESLSEAEQNELRPEYESCRDQVAAFQDQVTRYVLGIHPGFSVLGIAPLQKDWTGRGVRIAVFDAFDSELLEKQKALYPRAHWGNPVKFGNPVELTHGNTVIDIILQLAPEVTIIPISAEAKFYATAMQAIAARDDIDLLNMSRAFPEDPVTKNLDARFAEALLSFTQHGILVKALGNTGTDLNGQLNRRRVEKGLGPVNNITSYDLKLIKALQPQRVIFAENLSLFADEIAWTATVPGDFAEVSSRTLAVPAEGVYSPSSQTFESGSSFAAPQITAWLALLWQKNGNAAVSYAEIFEHANTLSHSAEEWGRGMPKP